MSFEQRVKETMARTKNKSAGWYLREYKEMEGPMDAVFAELPEQKCVGALLQRPTSLHWAFAAGALVLFGAFFLVANADRAVAWRDLGKAALVSALTGAAFLVLVGLLTERTWQWRLRESMYSLLLVPLSNCFNFSFRGALDPKNGVMWLFIGFTLVAGLCEELIKALPVLIFARRWQPQHWRGALLLGLASGAAFGIVEAIAYSRELYNGLGGSGTYLIAFLSSIALQAVWTGCFALTLHRHQNLLTEAVSVTERGARVCFFLFVPLLLHGLYDTLLKTHWVLGALAVGAASFLYLGLLMRHGLRAEAALQQPVAA
jgi:RsiW-degrading membrane proteinase PrsW (M82 family)